MPFQWEITCDLLELPAPHFQANPYERRPKPFLMWLGRKVRVSEVMRDRLDMRLSETQVSPNTRKKKNYDQVPFESRVSQISQIPWFIIKFLSWNGHVIQLPKPYQTLDHRRRSYGHALQWLEFWAKHPLRRGGWAWWKCFIF